MRGRSGYTDANADRDANCNNQSDGNADRDANCNDQSDSDADCNANCNDYSDGNANCNTDAKCPNQQGSVQKGWLEESATR
jgi:hypothetical protein